MAPLRLVFMGSDPIACPLLDWLAGEGAAQASLVAVYTQPDRPVGRGQRVAANGVKLWAAARGLPVYQPEKLTESVRGELAALRPDLVLVMAYGHILRQDFIDTPRLGTLNLHASILPRFRGASPIQTAVAAGVTETGVSLMRIVRQLDAGPVADVERVPVGPLDTAADIEGRLAGACVPLVRRALPALTAGRLAFVEQPAVGVTFCRRLVKDDGVLDFSAPASVLAARINGLFPWPACQTEIAGQPIKLGLADAVEGSGSPGQVVGADEAGLLVATGKGVLRLRRLQRPGGRMLPAPEFLRGFPVATGTPLPSRPLPVLEAASPFR